MRALIGVYDKTGVEDFARGLTGLGWEVISTGGTFAAIEKAGIPVRKVEDVTGFPEMLDGRVKTLHPGVHGGILARRDVPAHMQALADHNIGAIDLVACNLYPFVATVTRPGSPPNAAMFSCTHSRAAIWSRIPKQPEPGTSSPAWWKPAAPRR